MATTATTTTAGALRARGTTCIPESGSPEQKKEEEEQQEREAIPDYERFDYSTVWRGRGIEDAVEKRLVSRWARGESGVDLGGGFGRITQVLERRIGQMFLLDYSLSNLRRASSRLRSSTTLVRARLDRLPFEDDSFDFLSMIRVAHHIADPSPVLREVVRVARNGGTFVLGTANESNPFGGCSKPGVLKAVTAQGHRIYSTPLASFDGHPALRRIEIKGTGMFDSALGRRLERLWPLVTLDARTSSVWPAKPMLFIRYEVRKAEDKEGKRKDKGKPAVRCLCGGRVVDGGCADCGRDWHGGVIDLVQG